jgi:hypothetical protein
MSREQSVEQNIEQSVQQLFFVLLLLQELTGKKRCGQKLKNTLVLTFSLMRSLIQLNQKF